MTDRLPLPSRTLAIAVLNSSIQSKYSPKATFLDMFKGFFVEDWQISSDFEGYYNGCAPLICTYIYSQRMEILYVISVIVSVLGGLVVILRLLVPYTVLLLFRIIECRRNQHFDQQDPDINGTAGIF
ncbi:unnamed protein product [Rotaria sp. Silwood1]|nr:unnamed protein product [Rotaria sp. Silwood1]CAF4809073.1 unnamed protein product [Rotaria sp. Silwood1]CAF4980947.1 unnamed protein product [Rotaria sp. Silwood1]CAF5034241.1 unnamed protein product [Rotaria sp. Silwood1]